MIINKDDLEQFKVEVKADVRKCYGALASFQTQLHSISGDLGECLSLLSSVIMDMSETNKFLDHIRIFKDKYWRDINNGK